MAGFNRLAIFLQVPTGGDPLQTLVQMGVLGVILLMFLMGQLWTKPAVDAMVKRHEAEREFWQTEIRPELVALRDAVRENNRLLAELVRRRERQRGQT